MAGRVRNTKKLSQRIDREYFKRSYPIPTWRRILTLVLSVAGLAWVGWSSVVGSGGVYNAGPLAKKHHMLEANCTTCHSAEATFGRAVVEQSCMTCHDGPVHQERQIQADVPACMSCHVEHRGTYNLAAVNDAGCTGCHASLQTATGTTEIAANVTGFGAGHPRFRSEEGRLMDTGTIKFGHQVHMRPNLLGPDGPVQLECSTCHTLALDGAMTLANRAEDCDSCHRLEFYRRITDVLPHDRIEIVRAFALRSFQDYVARNPGDVNRVDPPLDPRIITPRPGPAGNANEWIRRRMEETETLLARKTCVECHTPVLSQGRIESIPAANFPKTWMTRAKFDHKPHQMVACASCHAGVETMNETSDVMLPGIESCQGCHHSGAGGADATCSECHLYHDWSKAKVIKPAFTIEQLLR